MTLPLPKESIVDTKQLQGLIHERNLIVDAARKLISEANAAAYTLRTAARWNDNSENANVYLDNANGLTEAADRLLAIINGDDAPNT